MLRPREEIGFQENLIIREQNARNRPQKMSIPSRDALTLPEETPFEHLKQDSIYTQITSSVVSSGCPG